MTNRSELITNFVLLVLAISLYLSTSIGSVVLAEETSRSNLSSNACSLNVTDGRYEYNITVPVSSPCSLVTEPKEGKVYYFGSQDLVFIGIRSDQTPCSTEVAIALIETTTGRSYFLNPMGLQYWGDDCSKIGVYQADAKQFYFNYLDFLKDYKNLTEEALLKDAEVGYSSNLRQIAFEPMQTKKDAKSLCEIRNEC